MISILIPVFNQNVIPLVKEIKKQCQSIGVQFQILVFDDGSIDDIKTQNNELHHEFGVNYIEMSSNLGRAKIRNRLGRTAMYSNLLFLDGDSKVIKEDFIAKYIQGTKSHQVIYGGRLYQNDKPTSDYMLHWTYGHKRETPKATKRNSKPYLNFQSNNFLISSKLFEQIRFDETVKGYGYEDLLFADEIRKKGISILHIDNPVLHDGLESNEKFIEKTENAVKNLTDLNKSGLLLNTQLSAIYQKFNNYGILNWVLKLSIDKSELLSNAKSSSPSMLKFSLWKLKEYDQLINK